MFGTGYSNHVSGFSSIVVDGKSGSDGLYLNDTNANDLMQLGDGQFSWSADGNNMTATGFDTQVVTSTNGGNDTVQFSDSTGDDQYYSFASFAVMFAGGSYLRAGDFETVIATASSGIDKAVLYDQSEDDTYTATANQVQIAGATYTRTVNDFETTTSFMTGGGTTNSSFTGTSGDDTVVGNMDWMTMSGAGYTNYVSGSSSITIDGGAGNDAFYLSDSAGNDQLELRPGFARLSNASKTIDLTGFETQVVRSENGGVDSVEFYDSAAADLFLSYSNYSAMIAGTTYHRADGFTNISAYGNAQGGPVDLVAIHTTSSVDQITLDQNFGRYDGGGLNRYFEGFDSADVYYDFANDQLTLGQVAYVYQLINEPN